MKLAALIILVFAGGASITSAKSAISFNSCAEFLSALRSNNEADYQPYIEFLEGYFAGAAISTDNKGLMGRLGDGDLKHRFAVAESCERFPSDSFGHVTSVVFDTLANNREP